MFNINNKVIVITGGCGSIGKAHTKALLESNVKGIGLLDIDENSGKALEEEFSHQYGDKKVTFIKCDVSNMQCMRKAFEVVIDTYSQLDIVINNAGIINENNVEGSFATNVIGVINGCKLAKEFLPKFKKDGEGIIINTSSIAGLLPFPCLDVYSATKAAIISYGRSLGSHHYYQIDNIKVITLCPGGTESNLISRDKLKKNLLDDRIKEFTQLWKVATMQSSEILAKKLIEIIKKANHGDIWVVQNGEEELINFPILFKP